MLANDMQLVLGWVGSHKMDPWTTLCQTSSQLAKRFRRYRELNRESGFFPDGGRSSFWICWACIWTIHDEYLVVSVVQNLLGIDA